MDNIILKKIVGKFPYIVIEGVIGAGKTTIASELANVLNANFVGERFEANPYLSKFYNDPQKYALPVQRFFLKERYKSFQKVKNMLRKGRSVVSDYGFFKNGIFAEANLKGTDLLLLKTDEFFKNLRLPKPDLVIWLTASEQTLLKHISKRGREYEKNIDSGYLLKLSIGYEKYFAKYKKPLIVVDMDNFDFENDKKLIYSLLEVIASYKSGTKHFAEQDI